MKRLTRVIGALALAVACSGGADPPEPAPGSGSAGEPAPDPVDLVGRGRGVYAANCTACHGPDPRHAAALGPEVADASRGLIEARVLRAEYPPGYEPKRDSTLMIAMPHLESEIDALVAYLQSVDGS